MLTLHLSQITKSNRDTELAAHETLKRLIPVVAQVLCRLAGNFAWHSQVIAFEPGINC